MELFKTILTLFADETETKTGCVNTALFGEVCDNCNGTAVMQILASVVRIMTYGVGILAVIGLLVFGIKYITSRGDESLAIKARRHLIEVLLGLASYVAIVIGASWLLPGDLTTTMLGGNPKVCPSQTKTDITVIEKKTEDPETSTPTEPLSGEWKTGDRPRECGPGTPGDFQTLKKNGVTVEGRSYWLYTNRTGRTYPQYAQGSGPWAGKNTKSNGKGCCTIAKAGCMITSRAMMNMSYSSGKVYVPSPSGDDVVDSNITRPGSFTCTNHSNCDHQKIKSTIDKGGTILVHACGNWSSSSYSCMGSKRSSHWFLIVDYRVKNGSI